MGRKLDALLGRNFKASKFKTLAKLAISRIGILKNQHQVRCTHARSDVIELLNLGHHEQALLRVEHLIREQNMVDAFTIMETYCNLLVEKVMLIQNNKYVWFNIIPLGFILSSVKFDMFSRPCMIGNVLMSLKRQHRA